MSEFRIGEAADLLGVSVDTVRRWADAGRLLTHRSSGGHRLVDGADLAHLAAAQHDRPAGHDPAAPPSSARNRFPGLVTKVVVDGVMAQVEIQAGPHRVVSLMSREAVEELDLQPGDRATAVVKATTVVVQSGA